jgi:hypothetical protein
VVEGSCLGAANIIVGYLLLILVLFAFGASAPHQQTAATLNQPAPAPTQPSEVTAIRNSTEETDSLTRINGLWCTPNDNAANVVSKAAAGNIKYLYLQVGNWATNGSGTVTGIDKWYSDQEVADWATSAKAEDDSLKVFGWVLAMSGAPFTAPDVDSSGNRAGIVTLIRSYVSATGLDGFNEDTENYTGSTSNLAVLWNAIGAGLHCDGKLFSVDSMIWNGYDYSNLYPNLNASNIDVVSPMLYDSSPFPEGYIASYMDYVLTHYAGNVAVGLMTEPQGSPTQTLIEQLAEIDGQISSHGAYSNFVGCTLWEYDVTLSGDCTAWNSWDTKDGGGGEPPAGNK